MNFIKENPETFIASLALLVSLATGIITYFTFHIQRKHNRRSLMPIINVNPFDYSNCLRIDLKNEGVGPAIIQKIIVEKNEHEKKSSVYDWMPSLPTGLSYSNYLTRDENIPMSPDKTIEVICIKLDPNKEEERQFREQMRGVLRQLTIKVEYTDVYNSKFPIYSRSLILYARTDNA